ncbi:MAG: helix-turn-helix domain-containing protein [Xenophilus sp.]
MTSKENTAAISQLLALLEARYALRVLWALRDGHPQTFRLLQDSVGGVTPNTLNTRLKELREAGLIGHGSDGYSLTLSGQDLLKRLSDLQAFAGKWQAGQFRKQAPAPAPPAVPGRAG